jgi:hypothetical protein
VSVSLTVERLRPDAPFGPVLAEYPYLPFADLPVAPERIAAYLSGRLATLAGGETSRVLGVHEGARLLGLAALDTLAWESEVFGIRMAAMPAILAPHGGGEVQERLIHGVEAEARTMGLQHLACRVPLEDEVLRHSLARTGFLLADTTLELTWDIHRLRIEESAHAWRVTDVFGRTARIFKMGTTVRPPLESDVEEMKALAREAFTRRTRTRYTADPALSAEATGELYAQWFENAWKGTFGDCVRIAADNSGPIGFQTFKVDRELSRALGLGMGMQGIGAVRPDRQKAGVALALNCSVLAWGRDQGLGSARGRVLANNYAMLKSCFLTGGVVTAAFHTFQKQLK